MIDPIDDTDPWARKILVQHWRSMSPAEKIATLSAHSIQLQELSIAGLRSRYPDAPEEELELRAAALRIGKKEFAHLTGYEFQW